MKRSIILLAILFYTQMTLAQNQQKPLRVGVAGLTHTHVHWLLGRPDRGDVEIVGIAEPNEDLAERYVKQHGLDPKLVYSSLDEMLTQSKPEAVTAFGTIFEHLEVVRKCAPLGVHVMVEKPLAVSLAHAQEMEKLAKQHDIQLLTNYETTWYPTNHKIFKMVRQGELGSVLKIVVHDGHRGPKEIGVNDEFLVWLTDPVQNGGGAITDFGCYGANLSTWIMGDQLPTSVSAITQQIKPDIYPNVDDEATIIITYPKSQTIIQASWNWPISRKDMELYGKTGMAIAKNRNDLVVQLNENAEIKNDKLEEIKAPYDDPFAYLAGVIRGTIDPPVNDLSSLENNMIVMQILDAAVKSAKKRKVIHLN
ncbi:MAG: Gfo/Idh/MocA family oxidoreductase [Bacteroidota bacterium]